MSVGLLYLCRRTDCLHRCGASGFNPADLWRSAEGSLRLGFLPVRAASGMRADRAASSHPEDAERWVEERTVGSPCRDRFGGASVAFPSVAVKREQLLGGCGGKTGSRSQDKAVS